MAKCIPLHSLVITVIISAAIILNLLLNSIVNQLDSILIDKNGVNNKNLEAIIHHYQEEDVVTCLNQLSLLKKSRINDDTVQISFVGDSTIRNLFKSFIRLIPDYDMKGKSKATFLPQHPFVNDRHVSSELLNLRVSFYWRPLADERLLGTFLNWTSTTPFNNPTLPDYIFMGSLAHHIHMGPSGFKLFSNGLLKLKPILNKLTRNSSIRSSSIRSSVVWMIQPSYLPTTHPGNPLFLATVPRYNKEAKSILKNSGVKISDSLNELGSEYTRSCTQNTKNDTHHWFVCFDSVHPGFVMLEHGTQSLLNDLCNNVILENPIQPIQKGHRHGQDTPC